MSTFHYIHIVHDCSLFINQNSSLNFLKSTAMCLLNFLFSTPFVVAWYTYYLIRANYQYFLLPLTQLYKIHKHFADQADKHLRSASQYARFPKLFCCVYYVHCRIPHPHIRSEMIYLQVNDVRKENIFILLVFSSILIWPQCSSV